MFKTDSLSGDYQQHRFLRHCYAFTFLPMISTHLGYERSYANSMCYAVASRHTWQNRTGVSDIFGVYLELSASMLKEDQVAELLARCEAITKTSLNQIRGNLRQAESRSAAIWDLLVLEEVSRIGSVEYEPGENASRDILLSLETGNKIWIEVAFLYRRFWKQEKASGAISKWIMDEAQRRGMSPYTVSYSFEGDRANLAGLLRHLPNLHEKMHFLSGADVKEFFDKIKQQRNIDHESKHSEFSLKLTYSPNRSGPNIMTGGGLFRRHQRPSRNTLFIE